MRTDFDCGRAAGSLLRNPAITSGSATSESAGLSACTSATLEPSYVLKALGLGDDVAHSSIRFGIGRFNTDAEIDYVADRMIDTVKKLRELSPLYEMVKEGIDLTKIVWQTEGH